MTIIWSVKVCLPFCVHATVTYVHTSYTVNTGTHTSNRRHPVQFDILIHYRLGKLGLPAHILERLRLSRVRKSVCAQKCFSNLQISSAMFSSVSWLIVESEVEVCAYGDILD